MIVTLRHRPPLWELHLPYKLMDGTTYLAGLLTEERARGYAAVRGWRITE